MKSLRFSNLFTTLVKLFMVLNEIFVNREDGLLFYRHFKKVSSILPGLYHYGKTDQPIRKAISKPDVAGCMVQWAIELSQFDIEYKPRIAIKAQALADFIAEFTLLGFDPKAEYWAMYADGSFVTRLEGVGVTVSSPEKDVFKYGVQLQFPTVNNEAEYEAILTNLRIAKALGAKNLKLNFDSKLIVR